MRKTRIIDEEEKNHTPFDDETVEKLMLLLENTEKLSAWEKSFLIDRAGAFSKYAFKAVITDKQQKILDGIHKRIRFDILLKKLKDEL